MGQYGLSFAPGKGPQDLQRTINKIKQNIKVGIVWGARDVATQIKLGAKETLRDRIFYPEKSTGKTEASIVSDITSLGSGVRHQFFVFTNDTAPWAYWVEEGHGSFEGHHFMREGFEVGKAKAMETIKESIMKQIMMGIR